jgi:hypothetical protein
MTKVALLAAALDDKSSSKTIKVLSEIQIPGAKKILFSPQKFDGQNKVAIKGVEAGYPESLVDIHNAYCAGAVRIDCTAIYRDAYDVICLNQLVGKDLCDIVYFVRDSAFCQVSPGASEWFCKMTGEECSRSSLSFDLRSTRARDGLHTAEQLYRSGAVLSLPDPNLYSVLKAIDRG